MRLKLRRLLRWLTNADAHDRTRELIGSLISKSVNENTDVHELNEVEFRVHSQWGDDGIIQWITSVLPSIEKRFIEFGVADYIESNTRFLLINNNWSGLVLDSDQRNIDFIKRQKWFWRYNLDTKACMVTRENVNEVVGEWVGKRGLGLLHIDVDGNDFWIWEALESVRPSIVIIEYNSVFGKDRAITIPYTANFERHGVHCSGLYAGASLAALAWLANRKNYCLIGCNSAGNNAYFVARECMNKNLRERTVNESFVESKFREARNAKRNLTYASGAYRVEIIRGMPVYNVENGETEVF